MPSRSNATAKHVGYDDLQSADYHFACPFMLPLHEGEFLAEKVVRLIPQKRLVAFGKWRGVPVVAKIFFDKKSAARHAEKDISGVDVLTENKIPTPQLHHKGSAKDDERIKVLIFARVQNATSLEAAWQTSHDDAEMVALLKQTMVELATQHVLGVVQHDLHLGNFLLANQTLYTLDGGQVEQMPEMLDRLDSIKNVALFLSQLGAGTDALQKDLFLHYANSRSWLLKENDTKELFVQIRRWNELRWHRFEKKIFRNCTDFVKRNRFGWCAMVRREALGEDMRQFLQNPESVFLKENLQMLKDGRSSTVIKVVLDGQDYVIKRNNMKSFWHWLRRTFRITRARKSWRLVYKLKLFNVNAATPVAYLERNVFGMTGTSYLVTKFVSGEDAGVYFEKHAADKNHVAKLAGRIAAQFRALEGIDVTHGDLKSTNIIINSDKQPVFIDLDGAVEHGSESALKKAWRHELDRFLQNFQNMPTIHDIFTKLLQQP